MHSKIDFKVPAGKLLRLKVSIDAARKFNEVRIAGDFFVYPEESITEIERFFIGKKFSFELEEELSSFIKAKKIKVVGFTPNDLITAIEKCLNEKGELNAVKSN